MTFPMPDLMNRGYLSSFVMKSCVAVLKLIVEGERAGGKEGKRSSFDANIADKSYQAVRLRR